MQDVERWREGVPLHGWDAWAAAMRDPALQLYEADWRGKLRDVSREDATRRVASGSYGRLCVVVGVEVRA